ncbi:hypothetical protein KEM55_003051, partial [Ascosphaera atra]
MDPGDHSAMKRDSANSSDPLSPVERRTSKKSSSNDRHGKIYPEGFRDSSGRAMSPEAPGPNGSQPMSENDAMMANLSTSPRNTYRGRYSEPQREIPSVYSVNDDEGQTRDDVRSVRASSRAATADGRRPEKSPNSTITKTRSRLGSMRQQHDLDTSFAHKNSEDSISSIGYPSIIHSPTFRQRLANPPQSAAASVASASQAEEGDSTFSASPLLNTDASKILQLMKTTCGRMHGILSFRTSGSGSWIPGYCAIN